VSFFKRHLVLFLVLLLALVVRCWNLSNNPPGLTWDEAALGYNAYSLLQTGKDEYGTFLPLNLKSFGDYKPALYAYLDIPFVAIFGLNEFAVRIPSALLGVLGVWGISLLVLELFKKKQAALLAGFLLAISPWHIQFSRPAYEANLALTLIIFATFLFVKQKLILSSILFGLSVFAYQGARIFVPLILLSLILVYRKDLKVNFQFKIAGGLLILTLATLFLSTFLTGQTDRLNTLNFFAYRRSEEQIKLISQEDGQTMDSFEFQLLHGEWFSYVRGLLERYVIYFSPKMLFIEGDYNQRSRVPDFGPLYILSAVFILGGLYKLIKQNDRASKLVLIWLLLAPIPGVLSRDLLTLLRSLNMVVPWVILEAIGCLLLFSYFKKLDRKFFIGFCGLISVVLIYNFYSFLDRYFIHAPIEYSQHWLYGYKQAFNDLEDTRKYNKVIVTDKYGQPYIYYLFYNKYYPVKFQQQAKLDQPTVDVGTIRRIDNIEFRPIYWPADRGEKNSLFLGTAFELPDQDVKPFPEFKILKEINYLDGQSAFKVVETQ
jgi:4-amino-4-deoxy-L-arabinose transferase-like glycosyltransferase